MTLTNEGKEACVIFCENHQACGRDDKGKNYLLRLLNVQHKPLPKK